MKKICKCLILAFLGLFCIILLTGCKSKKERYISDKNSILTIDELYENFAYDSQYVTDKQEYKELLSDVVREIKDIKMYTFAGKSVKKKYIKYIEECADCVLQYGNMSDDKFYDKLEEVEEKYRSKLEKAIQKFEKKYYKKVLK